MPYPSLEDAGMKILVGFSQGGIELRSDQYSDEFRSARKSFAKDVSYPYLRDQNPPTNLLFGYARMEHKSRAGALKASYTSV